MATRREWSLRILEAVDKAGRRVHRETLIGRPYQDGDLRRPDGGVLTAEDRDAAHEAFESLLRQRLLTRPRTDMTDPDGWVVISEAGRSALSRRALDDLDEALADLDPRFIDLREGMWVATYSSSPHRSAQAAHSARELVMQILSAHGGEGSRRDQIKSILRSRGNASKNDVKLIEATVTLVETVFKKLLAEAHNREADTDRDLTDLALETESALRRLLIGA